MQKKAATISPRSVCYTNVTLTNAYPSKHPPGKRLS